MPKLKAKKAFIQQLAVDGVKYIFGNPGTTEEGLVDIISEVPEIQFVMGLQESVVLGMAAGYGRATKRPAIVEVHIASGLGNAMGMLYQAERSKIPLIVYAGEAPSESYYFDGFFAGDLVALAKPITKWAYRITHGSSMPAVLRRAYKIAATPPQGPVFLSVPMDVFEEEIEPDIHPSTRVGWNSTPSPESVAAIAQGLMEAENPMIFVGDQIRVSEADEELMKVADLIGSPVYGTDFTYEANYRRDSLYLGHLSYALGEENIPLTRQPDAILAVGASLFPEEMSFNGPYFREGARLFQINLDPWEIGKNFPAEAGIMADPKEALSALIKEIEFRLSPDFQEKAAARKSRWLSKKQAEWEERQKTYDHLRPKRPMHASHMMKVVVEMLPEQAVVYSEALTSEPPLVHYLQSSGKGIYFNCVGRCLGEGLSGSVGAKLAFPERPVFALSGDGASLYVIQTLWTAAHLKLPIIFLICNNKSYRILKLNILNYWAKQNIPLHQFPHYDLEDPDIQYDKIAEGFGVKGWKASDPDSLRAAIQGALSSPGPHLIDVQIDGDVSSEIKSIMGT